MGERKRSRDCNEVEIETEGASVCKRFHGLPAEAEELIHMLEDAEEERNVAEEEVVFGVMKILEEEISLSETAASAEDEIRSPDVDDEISYLLRASDDELGIPCVMDSPLYSAYGEATEKPLYSANGEATFSEVWESGLWCFEDYNSNLVPSVYEEGHERDFGSCGSLFEVSEGDTGFSRRQESVCAM